MMMDQKNAVEQFLEELEQRILNQEKGINYLKEHQKERKYIKDLLEVLQTSKIGLIKEVFTADAEKKEEFYRMMKKVVSNDQEYHQLRNEIKNLYYLEEYGLLNDPFINPQKNTSLEQLDIMMNKCEDYLKRIAEVKEEERLKELHRTMESLFDLATKFDHDKLVEEITDIEFFQEVVRELRLPSSVKLDLISYVFERTNELHKKPEKKRKEKNAYLELERFYEEDVAENTEELLEELLGEKQHFHR